MSAAHRFVHEEELANPVHHPEVRLASSRRRVASVQQVRPEGAGAEASIVFRSALDTAELALTQAAAAMGLHHARVSAKCDPARDDAPVTLRDLVTMRDAGGRAREAARGTLVSLLATFEETALPFSAQASLLTRALDAITAISRALIGGGESAEQAWATLERVAAQGRAAARGRRA